MPHAPSPMLHAFVPSAMYRPSSCLGSNSIEPQLFCTLGFPVPCPSHLFWVSFRVSVRTSGQSCCSQAYFCPPSKGLAAYRSMLWSSESLKGRKRGHQPTLPEQFLLLLSPLLVSVTLLCSIPSPLRTQDSPQRDPAGEARSLQLTPQTLTQVYRPRPMGQSLSARADRLLAVQGAN